MRLLGPDSEAGSVGKRELWLQIQHRGSQVDRHRVGKMCCPTRGCDTLGPNHPCWRAFPLRIPPGPDERGTHWLPKSWEPQPDAELPLS